MVCPCCVRYCHAPDPCLKDIRVKVSWGPITGVSSALNITQPAGGRCGGTGTFETTIGICTDRPEFNFPVQVRLQIGGSTGSLPGNTIYQAPSCCVRTGQRTSRIFGGKVWCIVNNGPRVIYERSRLYSFSFATLEAAAVISLDTVNVIGDTTACGNGLVSEFVDTQPAIELLVSGNPLDFCDTPPVLGGFPAVSGPYGSSVQCLASCGNPLP
jgi:hypothetical protein